MEQRKKAFDAVKMTREIRNAHYEQTKDMTAEERIAFYRKKANKLHQELDEQERRGTSGLERRSGFDVDDVHAGFFGGVALAAAPEGEKRAAWLLRAYDHESVVGIDIKVVGVADGIGEANTCEANGNVFLVLSGRFERLVFREPALLEARALRAPVISQRSDGGAMRSAPFVSFRSRSREGSFKMTAKTTEVSLTSVIFWSIGKQGEPVQVYCVSP